MEHINQVVDQAVSTMDGSSGSSEPSLEAQDKAIKFFYRLVLVYGEGRAKGLWKDEKQFRLMRREWVDRIDELSWEDLETVFRRLKDRLEAGDPDYYWPDVARVLRLAQESDTPPACHQVAPRRLPEPEHVREQKRQRGRSMMRHAMAVLEGREEPQTEVPQ